MTNEKLFDLIQELLERMEVAKKEAADIKMNMADKDFPFVHIGDKEYVNPKFLPFEYHFQIVHMCKFLREHCELKQEDLNKILSMCKTRFAVLIKVNKIVPNLVVEARIHKEDKHIPFLYFGLSQNKTTENNINI